MSSFSFTLEFPCGCLKIGSGKGTRDFPLTQENLAKNYNSVNSPLAYLLTVKKKK